MKTITIVTAEVSPQALTAALPADGVRSVTITATRSAGGGTPGAGFRIAKRFTANYRIDLLVEDDAVEAVFDGIDFAYGAGLLSDVEAWIDAPALALSA